MSDPRPVTDDALDYAEFAAAVDDFARAMKAKFRRKQREGYSGWQDPPIGRTREALIVHAARRNQEVDTANLACMLWTARRVEMLKKMYERKTKYERSAAP